MKRSQILFIVLVLSFFVLLSASCAEVNISNEPLEAQMITVDAGAGGDRINPEIYGHFSEMLGRCIYDGIWVGKDSDIPNIRGIRKDVLEALKQIQVPVLRWPGGCFADEYHWKDGIGPVKDRPKIINTHWGMVVEDNSFGTHEFLDLCEMLDCEVYIAGNVGSGTPEEMMDWVEYMTFNGDSEMANLRRKNGREEPWNIRYFGVGNENWGCGGNMTPEYYADLYKRYATYVKNYPGSRINKVACGPGDWNTRWMEVIMEKVGGQMNAVSLHYYTFTGDWGDKGSAINFDKDDWFVLMQRTLDVNRLLDEHIEIMDRFDRRGRIGLYVDEWGTWWNAEEPGMRSEFLYQQNTLRDAVSAGIYLNSFNNHCERVKMANIAQTVNVLQAMILTKSDKMLLTPTYHVFDMYKVHQGARLVPVDVNCEAYTNNDTKLPSLDVSASRSSGQINITICNLNPELPADIVCELKEFTPKSATGRTLTSEKMNAHNTFDQPEAIKPEELKGIKIDGQKLSFRLPAKSVNVIVVEE